MGKTMTISVKKPYYKKPFICQTENIDEVLIFLKEHEISQWIIEKAMKYAPKKGSVVIKLSRAKELGDMITY